MEKKNFNKLAWEICKTSCKFAYSFCRIITYKTWRGELLKHALDCLLCPYQLLVSRVTAVTAVWHASPSQDYRSMCFAMKFLSTAYIPLDEVPERSLTRPMPTPQTAFQWCMGSGRSTACARWKFLTPYVHRKGVTGDTTIEPDRVWALTTHLSLSHLRMTLKNSSTPRNSWILSSCDPCPH